MKLDCCPSSVAGFHWNGLWLVSRVQSEGKLMVLEMRSFNVGPVKQLKQSQCNLASGGSVQ